MNTQKHTAKATIALLTIPGPIAHAARKALANNDAERAYQIALGLGAMVPLSDEHDRLASVARWHLAQARCTHPEDSERFGIDNDGKHVTVCADCGNRI